MRRDHERLSSPDLGRRVHVWCYGHFGPPLIVFPTAAGFAHEWEAQGMLGAVQDLVDGGRLKLYCPETNVSRTWLHKEAPPAERLARHRAYERFVLRTLVPFVRADCRSQDMPLWTAGASVGALYAAQMALKHPEIFRWALCLSGRYELSQFLGKGFDREVYFENPLAFVPNLEGPALERVKRTHLTLVCGQGRYEEGCIEETIALAAHLERKGIPHQRDLWGHDVAHDWRWWRRQARYHLLKRV